MSSKSAAGTSSPRPGCAGRVIIISGPSGSGKTTLHKALLQSPKLKGRLVKTISATTRPKRPGERQGRDYLFLSPKVFEQRIAKGYFLEWEKVFDDYYGTPKRQVAEFLKKGKSVLLCIDVKGARHVRQQLFRAAGIFIKTPSMKVLRQRLKQRASESHDDLNFRLKVARQELKEAGKYEHVVVNDHLSTACRKLERIVCRLLEDPQSGH